LFKAGFFVWRWRVILILRWPAKWQALPSCWSEVCLWWLVINDF